MKSVATEVWYLSLCQLWLKQAGEFKACRGGDDNRLP